MLQNKDQAVPHQEKGNKSTKTEASLPNAVVKRIVMLDADQTRVSPDAVAIMSRAAEFFLEALAAKAHSEAIAAARTAIAYRDVGRTSFM
jgi:histone H3/H4